MLRSSSLLLAPFGFIGLGQMGARMSPHALKRDDCDELVIFDRNPASIDMVRSHPLLKELPKKKITVAGSAAEVARVCPALLTMLPNGNIVRDVYTQEIFPHAMKGVTCMDCSTTDPTTPKELAQLLAKQDATAVLCDAPVSGGVGGAEAGTLSIMVGVSDLGKTGDQKAAFARVESYLKYFAKVVTNCGEVGSGAVCKLCNNLILGQHMVAMSEAVNLAEKYGVDLKVMSGVVSTSTGKSWSGDVANPVPGVVEKSPSSNGYKPGFGVQLMLKDMKLAVDAAETKGVATPGAKNALHLYQEASNKKEFSDKDFSIVVKQLQSMNK